MRDREKESCLLSELRQAEQLKYELLKLLEDQIWKLSGLRLEK